jgi:multicomponent Na+:H+ antiporter subunit A
MWVPLLLSLFPLALFVFFLSLLPDLASGIPWVWSLEWVPSLGLGISFRADGLGLTMALLISGIGALITIYGGAYLKGHKYLARFYVYLFLFMSAMLGIVLSNNLFGLFVFWELTSISSYLLIGFKHENESSRVSALQAFLVTGVGALAMLAGFMILASTGGSFEISNLLLQADSLRASSLYPWFSVLILLGAFTKSAQFPFHFWLPNAMAAPTPVSAYLHSATMVKAGVFLMARLTPLLGGTTLWSTLLLVAGFCTTVLASWMALGQRDIKKVLAYTTLAALGTLTLLLGLGTELALKAFLAFLVAHALYKACFFMLAGAVDHEAGTRDLAVLTRLRLSMPVTATIAVMAGVAFAGLPPTWSFIAKETALEAALAALPSVQGALTLLGLVLGAVCFVYLSALLVWSVFFRGPLEVESSKSEKLGHFHEAPLGFWMGPLLLALTGLVFGVYSTPLTHFLLNPAMESLTLSDQNLYFSLWHGISAPLLITIVVLLLGVLLYAVRSRIWIAVSGLIKSWKFSPEAFYHWKIAQIPQVSKAIFVWIQGGNLRVYLGTILAFALIFASWPLMRGLDWGVPHHLWNDVRLEEIFVHIAVVAGAILTLWSRKTFVALASTGIIGLSVAFYFVFYGAPDLAITQVLVEALSIILMILVLYHFSRVALPLSKSAHFASLSISVGWGALLCLSMILSLKENFFPSISSYYSENSYLLAHGRNIVNVILVDFRGWDTMGEITVLALASVGVYALVRWRKGLREGDTHA